MDSHTFLRVHIFLNCSKQSQYFFTRHPYFIVMHQVFFPLGFWGCLIIGLFNGGYFNLALDLLDCKLVLILGGNLLLFLRVFGQDLSGNLKIFLFYSLMLFWKSLFLDGLFGESVWQVFNLLLSEMNLLNRSLLFLLALKLKSLTKFSEVHGVCGSIFCFFCTSLDMFLEWFHNIIIWASIMLFLLLFCSFFLRDLFHKVNLTESEEFLLFLQSFSLL